MYFLLLLLSEKQALPVPHVKKINTVWFIKNEFILAKESMKKYICMISF